MHDLTVEDVVPDLDPSGPLMCGNCSCPADVRIRYESGRLLAQLCRHCAAELHGLCSDGNFMGNG